MGWTPIASTSDEMRVKMSELEFLLDGNLPRGMQLDQPITRRSPNFVSQPAAFAEMHAVVMVLPWDVVRRPHEHNDYHPVVRAVSDLCVARGIRLVVLLTHVDSFDCSLSDLSKLSRSTRVAQLIREASTYSGVLANRILPIQNYWNESHLSNMTSVLLLRALELICDQVQVRLREQYRVEIPTPHDDDDNEDNNDHDDHEDDDDDDGA